MQVSLELFGLVGHHPCDCMVIRQTMEGMRCWEKRIEADGKRKSRRDMFLKQILNLPLEFIIQPSPNNSTRTDTLTVWDLFVINRRLGHLSKSFESDTLRYFINIILYGFLERLWRSAQHILPPVSNKFMTDTMEHNNTGWLQSIKPTLNVGGCMEH
ncbi:uncharacterized protein LAJ45_04568 [Morchella importuna]|uniref:uncharacterized protein n=1 Tax=Morchella importuna TaxID=1174673 RepID=UPI001E8EED29|nr:uncharacterized protein LAJ45_04568 [Morchella importuna]KAH8151366.1 hypothetical protein LAJ45_04568 [Morchella importuna]